jgi:hypothetical protein
MLKKLLYLYNDGHNPFPHSGRGGLGYHLPQYRKRMHGESIHHINGEYYYYDDDEPDVLYEGREKTDFEPSDLQLDLIEGQPNIIFRNQVIQELKEFPIYEQEDTTPNVYKKGEENIHEKKVREQREQVYESLLEDEAEKLSNEALNTSMYELPLEELIDKRDLLIKESRETIREQYIREGKPSSNYDLAGKGYEYYLCNIALPLVQHITGDKSILYNNDDNLLIPESLRKYSVVDLYNEKNIIECKDYNQKSSIDNIPIQLTKLLGYEFSKNNKQELIFNENGNVVEMLVNGKNVLPDIEGGRKYYVYYRLDDGLYEYDVSSSIKKFIQKEAQGETNIKYAFDTDTIKSKDFKKIYGEIVQDDFKKPSFYLRKKYLKKITL